jgi:prepilin-type N-terminal cleavage/methylation domain-containing protein
MNSRGKSFWSAERGFSLAEMLVVVAIIGIMTLVLVPNFISMYNSSRFKGSARTLATSLRNARQIAISANTRTKVSFPITGTTPRSFVVEQQERDIQAGTTSWRRVRTGDLGQSITFTSTGFQDDATGDGGLRDVIFLPNGTIENLPPAEANRYVEISTTIKVPKKVYRLTFTPSGNVTLS